MGMSYRDETDRHVLVERDLAVNKDAERAAYEPQGDSSQEDLRPKRATKSPRVSSPRRGYRAVGHARVFGAAAAMFEWS
jgi:hypothetical protein